MAKVKGEGVPSQATYHDFAQQPLTPWGETMRARLQYPPPFTQACTPTKTISKLCRLYRSWIIQCLLSLKKRKSNSLRLLHAIICGQRVTCVVVQPCKPAVSDVEESQCSMSQCGSNKFNLFQRLCDFKSNLSVRSVINQPNLYPPFPVYPDPPISNCNMKDDVRRTGVFIAAKLYHVHSGKYFVGWNGLR